MSAMRAQEKKVRVIDDLLSGGASSPVLWYNKLKFSRMSTLRNKVQLIGHLGTNPDVRTLESGKKVVRFSLATNESYQNAKGEKVQETLWHSMVAWGKLAELAEKYLTKGSEVAIEGKLVSSSYTGKDNAKKYITEVQVAEILMLGSKK